MGLFDGLKKVMTELESVAKDTIDDVTQTVTKAMDDHNIGMGGRLQLSGTKHWVTASGYADDSEYEMKFYIDKVFENVDSCACEIEMVYVYAPNKQNVDEAAKPYVAIFLENFAYQAVEEYKNGRKVSGVTDLTPLNGRFYFKAKKEYHGDMIYFYGFDRLGGFWQNNALGVVYPKAYVGTVDETKVMKMLDEIADSYTETKIK